MAKNKTPITINICPFVGCNREFTTLTEMKQHYRFCHHKVKGGEKNE